MATILMYDCSELGVKGWEYLGQGHFLHFHSSLYNLDCYLRFASEQPGPAGSGRQYLVYRSISGSCGGYVGKVKEPRPRQEGLEGNFSSFGGMTYPITIHHQVFFCLVFPPDSVGILAVSCAKSSDVELDH
jgi:hypothetical protein